MKRMKSIMVMGDSISIHYGAYLINMLKSKFEVITREITDEAHQNLNLAVGGNCGDSGHLNVMLDKYLKDENYNFDILIFNCGLHDLRTDLDTGSKQVELPIYSKNLHAALEKLKKYHITPVWLRTTPVNDEVHNSKGELVLRYNADVIKYNAVADEIMEKSNVPIIDLYTFTQTLGEELYCDHVHFNESIRTAQAAFVAGAMYTIF